MDRSYRIKLERWLSEKTLNQQLLVACVAKLNPKLSKLAWRAEKYQNSPYDFGCKYELEQLQELIEYRRPFSAVLCQKCNMNIEGIKREVAHTLNNPLKSKNIPDYKTIDLVRGLLVNGDYTV